MQAMPTDEYENRVIRARQLMRKHGMDGLIVTDPVSYYYFTGQKVPTGQKYRPAVFILPLEGEPALITWSGPGMFARLYNRPFPSWVQDRRIFPEVPISSEPREDWGIADVLRERGLSSARIGIELGRDTWLQITVNDFRLLAEQLPKVEFVESGPVIWGCRMIKSPWEQDCMRKACIIGGTAWKRTFEQLRPGIAAHDVEKMVLQYYIEEGAELDLRPPLVLGATGPGRTFQQGDILYMDGYCGYAGYLMDFTRRAVFGKPSSRQLAEHNGMWDILNELIERMVPGTAVRELFEFSQKKLALRPEWKNYSDHPAKRIGHGIGMENEPPSISGTDLTILEEGMVLTPEPKIESVDGLVNPEEQVIVLAGGPEVISKTPPPDLFVVN